MSLLHSPVAGEMSSAVSDHWLPPGWTLQLAVGNNNGNTHKYYFSPSTGHRFDSLVEVCRYLDKAQSSPVSITRISKNVVVEKGIVQWLPQGWIKKTRVTTKAGSTRRDSYYIDPVSGYVFRSIKDVVCYLESGQIGRNAFKPKAKDNSIVDFEDDVFSPAGVAKKPKISVSSITQQTAMDQSKNLDGIVNDRQIPKPACVGESKPLPEHISCQCVTGNELISSVPSQAECSDKEEGKVRFVESNLVPDSMDGVAPEKQFPESMQPKQETEKVQKGQRKSKHKKEMNLPRRASKRLAGIQLDPVPELITRRRHAVKNSGEGEAPTNEYKSQVSFSKRETKSKFHSSKNTMESSQSDQIKHSNGNFCASEKVPKMTEEEHKSEKGQECLSFLPQGNQTTVKEHVEDLENGDKVNAKLDYSLNLPLGELLTDPCIAFAIQTLTGVTFETSKSTQISSELSNSRYSETSVAAKEHDKEVEGQSSQPKNLIIAEHAGGTQTDDKAKDNSGSSESPFGIEWMDPCIEFAVKTLSGTIPVEYDPNTKDHLQQPLGSSNTMSDASLSNLYQTDYYCSQYLGTQNPVFKQQSYLDPALSNSRSIAMSNSSGARLPQGRDVRGKQCL